MRLPRVRFTIGRLMIVVAVAGVLSAWLRGSVAGTLTVAAVLILGPPSIAFFSPFFVRPDHRLSAATWVACLWPLSFPWTLHAAWGIAYGSLGHRPGRADDGSVIEILAGSVAVSVLLSGIATMASVSSLIVTTVKGPWDRWVTLFILIPLVWTSVLVVCGSDPLGASRWLLDD